MTASAYLLPRGAEPPARKKLPLSPLDTAPEAPKGRLLVCGVGAAAAHLCVALLAGMLSNEARSAPHPERSMITESAIVELAPDPAPALQPPAPVARAKHPQAAAAVANARSVDAPAAPEQTIVTGDAATFAGGISESGGTSETAVRDIDARAEGVEGGSAKTVSLARAAALAGGSQWDCPFPEAADTDTAVVTLRVNVSKEGQVARVSVIEDPGNGFGQEAKRCALGKRWAPGLDDQGAPRATESLIKVRFER